MKKVWKLALILLVVAVCVPPIARDAIADNYPNRKIRIIVGFPPGGASDIIARIVATPLSKELGQTVYVENRPGASATLAVRMVAKDLPADGYNILLSSVTDAAQPWLRKDLTYNYERDLTHVSMLGVGPMVLVVNPSVPAHNLKELIALAKAESGKFYYGSAGIGSADHVSAALFNMQAGLNIIHVPYKGASDAIVGVLTGAVPMTFVVLSGALPLIEAGKLRPIAITSLERFPLAPNIPTLNESGLPGYQMGSWWGLSVSSRTPKPIVDRLNAAIVKAVNSPEIKAAINKVGIEPKATTVEEFTKFVHDRLAEDAKVLKSSGAAAERAKAN